VDVRLVTAQTTWGQTRGQVRRLLAWARGAVEAGLDVEQATGLLLCRRAWDGEEWRRCVSALLVTDHHHENCYEETNDKGIGHDLSGLQSHLLFTDIIFLNCVKEYNFIS
jgi:hypothetical protein